MNCGSTLVLAYGNPAREDDGIGPAAAEYLEKLSIEGVTVDVDYQLSIEDALAVTEHDRAIFIDAAAEGDAPFVFNRIEPDNSCTFTSHAVMPSGIAALAETLAGGKQECYLLGIRGYSFAMFKEEMTAEASHNLQQAMEFLVPILNAEKNYKKEIGGSNERQ
jgi:hydrogenase maturation protease